MPMTVRSICMRAIIAVTTIASVPLPGLASEVGEYTFTVLRNGDPVGQHWIAMQVDGDRVEISEATDIEVRIASIPVYRFAYRGRQLWEDGRVVRITGRTNDNGKLLKIGVRPAGDGHIRTVNGRVDRFGTSRHVFALWNMDTLKYRSFFSVVDDETFEASFQYVGREKLTIADQILRVDHYRMLGHDQRELWFDMAAHLARLKLRRRGSEIEYIRDQLKPSAPSISCSEEC
jgi:hypothetical protein